MSANKRKIGLYSLEFSDKNNNILTDEKLVRYFNSLIRYISRKEFGDKKVKIDTSNKFYYISSHNIKKRNTVAYLKGETVYIIFESAKIGHRPNLIDEDTGRKRQNPKKINEGEDELTHVAMKYKQREIIIALEERKVGVTTGQIVKYLNQYILNFSRNKQYEVTYNIIPYDGFLENLNKFEKIQIGTIYTKQQYVGSEFLNTAEFGDTIKDIIEISFKAEIKKSIKRGLVTQWHNMKKQQKSIERIRLEGKSFDGVKIRLDTESLKLTEHIDVKILPETGIVDSEDIFHHLDAIIKEM